jgi:pimeloyl-ACP methyl ester carboxylesterase
LAGLAVALMAAASSATAGATTSIRKAWLSSYAAPGTPESLNKVGVIKIGSSRAKNVLVIEPGTSGGGAYFVPLAKWLNERAPGWQVWAVERRENRLERQGELDKFKKGEVTAAQLFRYYLGYLAESSDPEPHYLPVSESKATADGARTWGMNVAVQDLHTVIGAAKELGGKVVLAGHSLGGTVVTAYATWDFAGKPGAEGLSGLVYIDGGSSPAAISTGEAEAALEKESKKSPWLAFGGVRAPLLGLFSMTGSALANLAPNEASQAGAFPLLPSFLRPHNKEGKEVTATNEATFGYGVNVGSSPPNLAAAQVHAGEGIMEAGLGEPWTWNGAGALTPLQRYAEMLSGAGLKGVDGSEWYFPERLTIDSGAVGNGIANPAQAVLGEDAIHGTELPTTLHILAINSELDNLFGGGFTTLTFAEDLAKQSSIPSANVTLVDVSSSYAHNDPNSAYPTNEFVSHLVPFLEGL